MKKLFSNLFVYFLILSLFQFKVAKKDISLDDLRQVLKDNLKQLAKDDNTENKNDTADLVDKTEQKEDNENQLEDQKKDLIKSFFTNIKQDQSDNKNENQNNEKDDANIIDVPSDEDSEDQQEEDPQTAIQTEQALKGLDTSISEDPAESIEIGQLTKSDVDNFKEHTKQMHDVTNDIHESMISLRDSKDLKTDEDALKRYNELRDKLAKVSEIYKKKYPQCLPIPISIIDSKSEKVEDKKTQECRYAYYLGYNYVINWIQIIDPLQMSREEAWAKIQQTQQKAFQVNFQNKQSEDRELNFKLSGKCYAKGMKASYIRNYDRKLNGIMVEEILNPKNDIKGKIQEMQSLVIKIQKVVDH